MHVIFRLFGQGEIHHMADAIDMNPAPGNIGRDQYTDLARLKPIQRRNAFLLRYVTGQFSRFDPVFG